MPRDRGRGHASKGLPKIAVTAAAFPRVQSSGKIAAGTIFTTDIFVARLKTRTRSLVISSPPENCLPIILSHFWGALQYPVAGSHSRCPSKVGSGMRESRTYGSARGARSNTRPYRDSAFKNLLQEKILGVLNGASASVVGGGR